MHLKPVSHIVAVSMQETASQLTDELPVYNKYNGNCKAPTLRLEALNRHTHIMYIDMENATTRPPRPPPPPPNK